MLKPSKLHLFLLFAILLIAATLRLYGLSSLMLFGQDPGWYYLQARDIFSIKTLPLVGIPSSVPVLKQGAIWSWILALALKIGNFNPLYGGYLSALFGVVSVFLIYKLVTDWYGKQAGIVAGIVAATIPFLVITDRIPYVLAPSITAMLATTYFFDRAAKNKGNSDFFFGVALFVATQFVLGTFIIFPIFVLTLFIMRVKVTIKQILRFLAGAFIGILPFYIHDLIEGTFIQTVGFFLWFFGKPFEFLFIKGTRASMPILTLVNKSLSFFVFPYSYLIAVSLFGLAVFFFFRQQFFEAKEISLANMLIVVWLFVSFVSFALRGIYSYAFLPTMVFPVLVILALFFNYLIRFNKYLGITFLGIFVLFNTVFIFKNNFVNDNNGQNIGNLEKLVGFIEKDSGDRGFNYIYAGKGNQYPSSGNNFDYLFWYKGMVSEKNAKRSYVIFDNTSTVNYPYVKLEDFGYYRLGVLND